MHEIRASKSLILHYRLATCSGISDDSDRQVRRVLRASGTMAYAVILKKKILPHFAKTDTNQLDVMCPLNWVRLMDSQ